MKFFVQDFLSKCEQILRKLWIYSPFLKTFLTETSSLCAVGTPVSSCKKGVLKGLIVINKIRQISRKKLVFAKLTETRSKIS